MATTTTTTFYKTIIDDEVKTFNIKEESLKVAAKSVSRAYSRNSLNIGQTFLDYNNPSNRVAYIYKYASIHTALVIKYFNRLICEEEVKATLQKSETLKICCLGGGPGTDIVGLFKVLASSPNYHKKVVEVTVLDICGGWRNSFKRVMENLISGKVKDVPESFINVSNFKFKLIEIDLLLNLPTNIVKILSEADIVCMVKFVSAILGSSTSVSALQVISSKLKEGAVVLFIDNLSGNVFKPFFDVSQEIGLKLILGPIHEAFNYKKENKSNVTLNERKIFGCLPLNGTAVSILGFLKSDKISKSRLSNSINASVNLLVDNEDGWDIDDDSETLVKKPPESPIKKFPKIYDHKFTQTDKEKIRDSTMHDNSHIGSNTIDVLYPLVDGLCNLLNVLSQLKEHIAVRNHCHDCHL